MCIDVKTWMDLRWRAMEFDRPIDGELGAALGGVEDNNSVRDDGTPELHPEQQIRDAEEMRTLPRRQPRGVGSQQPRGPRVGVDESTSGPGYMAVPPARTMGRDRLYSDFADATGNRTRASGATGGTDDDEGSLV